MRYKLMGYDKDNDVYDFIMDSDDYNKVYFTAFVIYPMLIEDRLLSKDNREPYDWFEIWDTKANVHEVFDEFYNYFG